MKVKTDFVTNSSSASFIIEKSKLTKRQIYLIFNHVEVSQVIEKVEDNFISSQPADRWHIFETKRHIKGSTIMDNFDMKGFLDTIGVSDADIDMYDYEDYSPEELQESYTNPKSKHVVNYFIEEDDSPCKDCIIVAMCTKSMTDETICDPMVNFIFQQVLQISVKLRERKRNRT